jgi:hypothetical protein
MFNHKKTTQNLGGHFIGKVTFIDDITVREPDQRNVRRLVYKYALSMQQSKRMRRKTVCLSCRRRLKDDDESRRGAFIIFKEETR